jgi:hypothetical protein
LLPSAKAISFYHLECIFKVSKIRVCFLKYQNFGSGMVIHEVHYQSKYAYIQNKVWRQNQFFVTSNRASICFTGFTRCFKLQLHFVKKHATIVLLEKRLLMFVNVEFNMKSCSNDVIKISGSPLICTVVCHRKILDFLAQHH